MIDRDTFEDALDGALKASKLISIIGLPRVGRSAFIRQWAQARQDVSTGSLTDPAGGDAGILYFDHLDRSQTDTFVAQVRTAEARGQPTRFIALPHDFAAADHLRTALSGVGRQHEFVPLQLGDLHAEHSGRSLPKGPSASLDPQPAATNITPFDPDRLWLRGGMPESLEAETDAVSVRWRRGLIGDLLSRDYSGRAVAPGAPLHDIFRWLANKNGDELDEASCPLAKKAELQSVLYVLEKLGLIRLLRNFPAGETASFSKKRKLFIRDTGILHALLGVETIEQLRASSHVGDSFESFAIDALITAADGAAEPQFYRERVGDDTDEMDLVLDFSPRTSDVVAIEFKVSPSTGPRPGFYRARERVGATHCFLVHSGPTSDLDQKVERLDLMSAIRRVRTIAETESRRRTADIQGVGQESASAHWI